MDFAVLIYRVKDRGPIYNYNRLSANILYPFIRRKEQLA